MVCTVELQCNHQELQVPKMEVLNLIRPFWGWVFPYISLTYSLYRWGFLHFRYLKCLVMQWTNRTNKSTQSRDTSPSRPAQRKKRRTMTNTNQLHRNSLLLRRLSSMLFEKCITSVLNEHGKKILVKQISWAYLDRHHLHKHFQREKQSKEHLQNHPNLRARPEMQGQ